MQPNLNNVPFQGHKTAKNDSNFKRVMGLTNAMIDNMTIYELEEAMEKYNKIKG